MSTEPQSTAASVVETTKQAVVGTGEAISNAAAGAYHTVHDAIYPPPTAAENANESMKEATEATKEAVTGTASGAKDAAVGAKDVVAGAGQGVKEGFQAKPSE